MSAPGEVKAAVKTAVECGYRLIDCAYGYENEGEIGEAFKELFEAGTVKREDLFITSKLWNTFHPYDYVKRGLDLTLKNLGLDYLDLYLLHWPIAFQAGDVVLPTDKDGKVILADTDYLETWRGLEDLLDSGRVRSIGVSNVNISQIQRILDNCRVKPAMLQIEMHPHLPSKELIEFAHSHGIAVTAYSSLGCSNVPDAVNKVKLNLLEDPRVKKIAEKHHKSTNHVLLRFAMDQNVCVIPKSVTAARIKDNLNVFDFTLDQEDIEALRFEGTFRIIPMDFAYGHKYHPFDCK
jgi:aldehyde reductase